MLLMASFPHSGNLLESLMRGFAWSIGWMLARQLGWPIAAGVLGVVLLFVWWRRRRGASAREKAEPRV